MRISILVSPAECAAETISVTSSKISRYARSCGAGIARKVTRKIWLSPAPISAIGGTTISSSESAYTSAPSDWLHAKVCVWKLTAWSAELAIVIDVIRRSGDISTSTGEIVCACATLLHKPSIADALTTATKTTPNLITAGDRIPDFSTKLSPQGGRQWYRRQPSATQSSQRVPGRTKPLH